jgi:hypothetical protein
MSLTHAPHLNFASLTAKATVACSHGLRVHVRVGAAASAHRRRTFVYRIHLRIHLYRTTFTVQGLGFGFSL